LSTDGSQSPIKHSANGIGRRNANGSQGNKRKANMNSGVMAYPNQSGATPQNIKPNEEVKSKSMRSGKPPTSEGFSGAAASHQQLDENASENTPNLHSALQGGGGD
jgi:hypothetical protein